MAEEVIITGLPADIIVGAFILGGAWILFYLLRMPGYRQLIEQWCLERHLRLVKMERRWLLKGPFFLSPNGTAVFHLTTRDPLGRVQHHWARCGHWLFGMLSPEIKVLPAD